MESKKPAYRTIDEYIAAFPPDTQKILEELRAVIHSSAPNATEKISYQMPAFDQNGILVYFAAYQKHIGFYPTASGISAFRKKLTDYECSKGTVKFPIEKPLPFDLIREIVAYRVQENQAKK